jgi:hypothetical protein
MDGRPLSELVVIEDGAGTLLVGVDATLEAVLAEWSGSGDLVSRGSAVTGTNLEKLTTALGVGGDKVARYVRTRMSPPPAGELRWVTRNKGKYASNVPASAMTGPLGPELVALQVALEAAVQEILAAVADVQDTVDEILRLASAQRAGDVYGRRRLLQRVHDELRAGNQLTDTDWSSVAGMGPDLEVGVEALRQYANLLVNELADRRSADDRAEALRKLNETNRLGSALRLLVAAEQSFYLWQLIRIRRVQLAESNYLEQTMTSARAAVAQHHSLDSELSRAARTHLTSYARLSLSEFHRTVSGRKLQREVAPLQAQLDEFAAARGLQADRWETITNPGVRDAITAIRQRSDDVLGSSSFAVGRATGAVERWAAKRRGGSKQE